MYKLLMSFHQRHYRITKRFYCLTKCGYFVSELERFLPAKIQTQCSEPKYTESAEKRESFLVIKLQKLKKGIQAE